MLTLVGALSSGERNRPPETRTSSCVEISDRASAPRAVEPRGRRVRCCGRSSARTPSRRRARSRANGATGPPSNCVLSRRAERPPGPSSTRRSAAWWRSPLGARIPERRGQRGARGAGLGHALEPSVVERCPGIRSRRRAGTRSRTASGWRSWSRRGCTGRARSPPTAATSTSSLEVVSHRSPRRAASLTHASSVARPRSSFSRWSASNVCERDRDPGRVRVVVLDRLPPHRHRHAEVDRLRPRDQHHLQPAVLAGVVDHPVEVQRERRLAVGERVQVLGRGELEVVVARDRDRDRGRSR